MEATVFTSLYVSNLPNTKAKFNTVPLSSSSCWLCNSQAKRITKLRLREGSNSNRGIFRVHALFHNEERSSESEDGNGFGFFPADVFSLSQVNEAIKDLCFCVIVCGF